MPRANTFRHTDRSWRIRAPVVAARHKGPARRAPSATNAGSAGPCCRSKQAPARSKGRRPPRIAGPPPRHGDWAATSATHKSFADLACIKRNRAYLGSPHRGPTLRGFAQVAPGSQRAQCRLRASPVRGASMRPRRTHDMAGVVKARPRQPEGQQSRRSRTVAGRRDSRHSAARTTRPHGACR